MQTLAHVHNEEVCRVFHEYTLVGHNFGFILSGYPMPKAA